jgi:hypothetical protein
MRIQPMGRAPCRTTLIPLVTSLQQWYSTWGTQRHLTSYVNSGKNYFVINIEYSGPDLALATVDPDVRTFDYQVRTSLIIYNI